MKIYTSTIIEKPIQEVFDFCVTNHVTNHPRWDVDIKLEQLTPGDLEVGTVIKRTNTRYGKTVVGEMTVLALEPGRSVRFEIVEGPITSQGGIMLEAIDDNTTKHTSYFEVSDEYGMQKFEDTIKEKMVRSGQNIKNLMGG